MKSVWPWMLGSFNDSGEAYSIPIYQALCWTWAGLQKRMTLLEQKDRDTGAQKGGPLSGCSLAENEEGRGCSLWQPERLYVNMHVSVFTCVCVCVQGQPLRLGEHGAYSRHTFLSLVQIWVRRGESSNMMRYFSFNSRLYSTLNAKNEKTH